jgi:hypothetical protein
MGLCVIWNLHQMWEPGIFFLYTDLVTLRQWTYKYFRFQSWGHLRRGVGMVQTSANYRSTPNHKDIPILQEISVLRQTRTAPAVGYISLTTSITSSSFHKRCWILPLQYLIAVNSVTIITSESNVLITFHIWKVKGDAEWENRPITSAASNFVFRGNAC